MAKTSSYYCIGDKVKVTDKLSVYLEDKYDDPIYISGYGSIIPDPNKTWFVKNSLSLSGDYEMIDAMNGNNLYGETLFYIAPKGFYYNEDMKTKGIIPINFHLVGSKASRIKVTTNDQLYYIGWYAPKYHFSTWDNSDTLYNRIPYFNTEYANEDPHTKDVSNFVIDERTSIPIEQVARQLTTGNSSVQWFLYDVYSGNNGKLITLICQSPLIFTNEGNSYMGSKPIMSVTLTKPSKQNASRITVYGVHSASPIYMCENPIKDQADKPEHWRKLNAKLCSPVTYTQVSNTHASPFMSWIPLNSLGFTSVFGGKSSVHNSMNYHIIVDDCYNKVNKPIMVNGVEARDKFTRASIFNTVYKLWYYWLHIVLTRDGYMNQESISITTFLNNYQGVSLNQIRKDIQNVDQSNIALVNFSEQAKVWMDKVYTLVSELCENWTDLPQGSLPTAPNIGINTSNILWNGGIAITFNWSSDTVPNNVRDQVRMSPYHSGVYYYINDSSKELTKEEIMPIGYSTDLNNSWVSEIDVSKTLRVKRYFTATPEGLAEYASIEGIPADLYDEDFIRKYLNDPLIIYDPEYSFQRLLGHPLSRSAPILTPDCSNRNGWASLSWSSIYTVLTPFIQWNGPYCYNELYDPIYPSDMSVLQPNINYPFPIEADTYKSVSFDREYEDTEKFGTFTKLMTDEHYSSVRSIKDDIIGSDEIDSLLGLDKLTDDYFIASLLKTDLDHIKQMNAKLNTLPTPEEIVEKTMNDLKKKEDELVANTPSGQVPPVMSPIDKHNLKDTLHSVISDNFSQVSHSKIEESQDQVEDYHNFKLLFLSKLKDETKTGIIGHTRILSTNITESPLYNSIKEEYMISDEKIKTYANMLKQEYDSMLQTDVWTLVDTLDSINEVNIISSMVNDQLSELNNAFETLSDETLSIRDQSMEKLKQVNDKVSAVMSIAKNTANTIIEGAAKYRDKASEMLDKIPGSYDQVLFTRNIDNATGYLNGFASALLSDPYLALKQHSDYIRSRTDKISIKSTVIDSLLKVLDFIPTIPSLVLEGIGSVAKLVTSMAGFAMSTALETVTIIDNIDKIVFLSEQYLSKGIVASSTIPTVYDDMFTPPTIATNRYKHLDKKALLSINVDLSITKEIKQKLLEIKDNPIQLEDGSLIKYNDYDVDELFGDVGGFYYPVSDNLNLPIIQPMGDTSHVLPDLTEFIPTYPQRGNLWKHFLYQLAYDDNDKLEEIKNLSPFIPVTEEVIALYYAFSVTASFIAGAAASSSALLRGDWIGAAIGAATASALVFGVNVAETHKIANRRTYINSNDNVYSYFYNNKKDLTTKWETLSSSLVSNKDLYKFVMIKQATPLFHDASDFKKYFLQVKEVLFLLGNIVTMGAVSLMIGKIGSKISSRVRAIKAKKALKVKNRVEREKYKNEADKLKENIQERKNEVLANDSLSQQEKDKIIQQLDSESKNVDKWLKGETTLLPVNKVGINGILASKYGIGSLAISSAAPGIVALGSLGPLTEQAIKPFSQQLDKLNSLNPDINKDNMEVENALNSSESIGSIVSTTSELLKTLFKVQSDVDEIKKFV